VGGGSKLSSWSPVCWHGRRLILKCKRGVLPQPLPDMPISDVRLSDYTGVGSRNFPKRSRPGIDSECVTRTESSKGKGRQQLRVADFQVISVHPDDTFHPLRMHVSQAKSGQAGGMIGCAKILWASVHQGKEIEAHEIPSYQERKDEPEGEVFRASVARKESQFWTPILRLTSAKRGSERNGLSPT
jgi:hypothetical protein